eukprot:8539965-Alexandrium_andersonii.AAC.1
MSASLVGSEMCIRDRNGNRATNSKVSSCLKSPASSSSPTSAFNAEPECRRMPATSGRTTPC